MNPQVKGIVRRYDGILFASIDANRRAAVSATARRYVLIVSIQDASIEFSYDGRDSNHFVLHFLYELAKVIVDSEGEIACTVTTDIDVDPIFEFYTIRQGRLCRQIGRIAREEITVVM